MPDRSDTITSFLRTTEWADAAVQPLAGDASMRKYLRIGPNSSGRPAVLMDADPALGNDTGPFIKITDYLRSLSLSAPEIYARDEGAGLLLIEDLGDALFARVTQTDPDMEETLYAHATDVLLHLHRAAPPALTEYDTAQMTEMARPAGRGTLHALRPDPARLPRGKPAVAAGT